MRIPMPEDKDYYVVSYFLAKKRIGFEVVRCHINRITPFAYVDLGHFDSYDDAKQFASKKQKEFYDAREKLWRA